MAVSYFSYCVERRIAARAPASVAVFDGLTRGGTLRASHADLVLSHRHRFLTGTGPTTPMYVAHGRLYGTRGVRSFPVEVEISAWSTTETHLVIRPSRMVRTRHSDRYFDLASDVADAIGDAVLRQVSTRVLAQSRTLRHAS